MGEESLLLVPSASDRALEQAIVALKKGAHLLKYGRRGKPKFCPFRLSMDEKYLIWYSGQDEKQLKLSSVTNIIHGQSTKQLQPEKESQCISLIYANGKSSLELICKDKVEAESWFIGLRAVISRNYCKEKVGAFKKQKGTHSCINSPAAFMRRKHILGLSEEKTRSSQVHSLSGIPLQSFSARCISSDSFYSASSQSSMHNVVNILAPSSPFVQQHDLKNQVAHILKDIYIWGEGALLPKLLESTMMLDVRTISLGTEHAALVTNQGEVLCWGEGKIGRPKIVDSLIGVHVNHIFCGENQTCALTLSGELYTWGNNRNDDLLGEDNNKCISHLLPRRLYGSLDGVTISSVACGAWHTAIVSTHGQLFTYGDGTFGVLGHGDVQSYHHPKEVESIRGLRVKVVACGPWHTAAIIDGKRGKLFTWGDSDKGRLGHHPSHGRKVLLPTYVEKLFEHDFVQVSCGDTLTASLTSTGRVYTMGSEVHGQLGGPQVVGGRLTDEFVVEMSCGSYHIAVLTLKGNVYTWGKGENGQLGLGDTKDRNSPSLVDSLKGYKVEKITCGSSSTAAICSHKSLSRDDQLSCKGCGNHFGFTRKRHNCYNCGRLFCGACSSKRSTCASRATCDNKAFRVCNGCFTQLQKSAFSKLEADSPRSLPVTRKGNMGNNGGATRSQTPSIRKNYSYDGGQCSGRKYIDIQGQKPQTQDNVFVDKELPRWGQVSCPRIFMENYEFPSLSSVCLVDRSMPTATLNVEKHMRQQEKFLHQEIQKLKAQADILENLCQTRKEKIVQNRKGIEEAWSLANEEAAECKEAKQLIQALTLKLCAMSEKLSSRQEAEEKASLISPQTKMHPVLALAYLPTKDVEIEDKNVENLCRSPIVFSNKLRSSYGEYVHSGIGRTDSVEMGIKSSKSDWIEQYQPGVYITFTTLPGGRTGIRRVRFSRRKFNDSETKRWWEENQQAVYRNYGIDGNSISDT